MTAFMYHTVEVLPMNITDDEAIGFLMRLAEFDLDVTGVNSGEDETPLLVELYHMYKPKCKTVAEAIEQTLKHWLDADDYYLTASVKSVCIPDGCTVISVAATTFD